MSQTGKRGIQGVSESFNASAGLAKAQKVLEKGNAVEDKQSKRKRKKKAKKEVQKMKAATSQTERDEHKKSAIDDIFNQVKKAKREKNGEKPETEEEKKRKKRKQQEDDLEERIKQLEENGRAANRMKKEGDPKPLRYDAELGMNIYSEESLKMNIKGGATPLCPFDCSCCY